MELIDRYRGAMLGMAAGDALGTPVEFHRQGNFEPITDMTGGGTLNQAPGVWTDGTSMALCLAESLLERERFDPEDQLHRYLKWHQTGHLAATGRSIGIGYGTLDSLERFEETGESYPGEFDPETGGNGALMRLAPIPLVFATDTREVDVYAGRNSRVTHGSLQSLDACRYFSGLILGALRRVTKEELIGGDVWRPRGMSRLNDLEVRAVAEGSFREKSPPEIRGKGYVVNALEAALWALWNHDDFESGALAAANLGEDANSTASIYGQLAGALYGVDAIPDRWLDRIVMREEITDFSDRMLELAQRGRPPHDAYWVTKGRLMAGPYPGAADPERATNKLTNLVEAGVTHFVDLTFAKWKGTDMLEPYEQLLPELAAEKQVGFSRYPIRDMGVPTADEMDLLLAWIGGLLGRGEVVYLHCSDGVGRTGIVVGCLIARAEAGVPTELDELAKLRDGLERCERVSPEISEQRSFVAKWCRDRLTSGW